MAGDNQEGPDCLIRCPRPEGPCTWTSHGLKHYPFEGMQRRHTQGESPARYLEKYDAEAIKALESATAQQQFRRSILPGGKAEYARDVETAIGWDEGQDAMWSFVECSGGIRAGRSFHGRPMHLGNRKLR